MIARVLFGTALFVGVTALGQGTVPGGSFDLSRLEANEWVQMRTAGRPEARGWVGVTFDQVRKRVFLFGGSGGGYYSDTWYYDLGRNLWVLLVPHGVPNHPNGRDNHVLVYDPINDLIWSYNGTGSGGWWYYTSQDNRWHSANATGPPRERTNPGLVFDEQHGVVVLFGGDLEGNPSNETWTFDVRSKTWIHRIPSSSPPPTRDAARAMVYDRKRQRALLLVKREVWTYDAGDNTWTRLPGGPSPPGVFSLAYDRRNDVLLAVGGWRRGSQDPTLQTWAYILPTGEWRELRPRGSPAARVLHQLTYDDARNVFILYGGTDLSGRNPDCCADAWVYRYAGGSGDKVPEAVEQKLPTVSSVRIDNVTAVSAEVTALTDQPSLTLVEYGPTPDLGSLSRPRAPEWARGRIFGHLHGAGLQHVLVGLVPERRYYFRIRALDPEGRASVTPVESFVTAPPSARFINFQPPGWREFPPGYEADTGAPYDAGRGYGWIEGRVAPIGNDGGIGYVSRYVTGVRTAAKGATAVWRLDVPNGEYLVSLAAGDTAHNAGTRTPGPHRVELNGLRLVDDVLLEANYFAEIREHPFRVTDGRIVMAIGGTSGRTAVAYITVRPARSH
ncbi:MAG: kelch repeat-containing protein [Candidatus Rokuibacteriota bacterium]